MSNTTKYVYSKPQPASKLNQDIYFFRQQKEPTKKEILNKVFNKNMSNKHNNSIKK